MKKVVLITGVTGQDGSYLSESFLNDGWQVHGLIRRSSSLRRERIDHLADESDNFKSKISLHYSNLTDSISFSNILDDINPSIVINLAAQSHVGISFQNPMETIQTNGTSVLNQLESIKKFNPNIIYYQAGTSEMFGGLLGRKTLREDSSFFPKSPYAISKLMAHKLVEMYRERTIEYAHNGILFNHESPRRSENFVSRKISLAAARIALGLQEKLLLGNVNAVRDWGHARDYVAAIRKIVESNLKGENWVVATGESKSVEEFAFQAFSVLNLDYTKHLIIDKSLFRLNEVHDLLGDSSKIRSRLNWEPKISFSDLVREMVLADYAELARIKEFKDES